MFPKYGGFGSFACRFIEITSSRFTSVCISYLFICKFYNVFIPIHRLKIDFLFFFQIIFRFEMGTGFGSSAALDDIITRDGSCN